MASDKILQAAAGMLADSSRSLEKFAVALETIVEKQEHVLDGIMDRLEAMSKGKGGAGGGEKKTGGIGSAIKGFAGDFKTLASSLGDLAEAGPKLKEGFKALTEGLKSLNLAMKVFQTVDKGAVNLLTDFLTDLSNKFEEMKLERIQKGAEAIDSMSDAIIKLGLTLVASTLLFAVGAVGSLIIVPLIAGYALIFNQLGDKDVSKNINAGAESMFLMGIGLLSFGLGLFAVKELAGGNWGDFAEGALIVALGATVFGFLFYEIGKPAFAKRIEDGSMAMLTMGIGLASLALGIFAFQALAVDLPSILITGAAVLIVGVAMGIAGIFSKTIEEGAIALVVSGIGLASLALGIWSFQALGVTFPSVLIAGAAILIVGVAMGLAGVFALEIALGGLAFIVSGIALYALAKGIMSFDKIEQEDIGIAAESIVGIGLAMAGAGLVSPLIGFGAASVMLAGAALSNISKGLKEFKDVKFDETDKDKISMVISGLSSAFSLAGSEGSKLGGVMGFLGIEGPNAVKRGIDSVMGAGRALKDIAQGLADFSKMTAGMDMDTVQTNIVNVLTAVSNAFGSIGNNNISGQAAAQKAASSGLWGTIFGSEDNAVAIGVDAVKGMGKEITDLAEGVRGFATMTFKDPETGKTVKLTPADLTTAAMNIASVLTTVSTAFGTIGSKAQVPEGGILGTLFGAKDNVVAEGVSATKGMGKEIADLAEGVRAFATMTFKDPEGKTVKLGPADLLTASTNIKNVLMLVSSVFGQIGSGTQQAEGGILGTLFGAKDNAVKLGVEAVSGIGKELKSIADSVVAFASVTDLAAAQKNITGIISSVPIAFAGVYTGVLSKLDVGKMKSSFTPILSMLSSIVESLGAVKDKKITDKDTSVLSNAISSIFASIDATSGTDTGAFEKATSYIERLADKANPLDKLASAFEKIAKNVDKFTTSFKKMDQGAVKTADMLIQSMIVFSKVDPDALSTKGVRAQELLQFIIEKNPNKETPGTEPAPAPSLKEPGRTPVPVAKPQAEKSAVDHSVVAQQQMQVMQGISDTLDRLTGIMGRVESRLYETLKVQDVSK